MIYYSPITMCWICEQQNRGNLNESITLGHIYLEIRALSSKIGGVKKRYICLNFRAKKKSPHGGLWNTHPQASMRGFFFCLEIEADIPFFNTAKCKIMLNQTRQIVSQKEGKFWNWSGRLEFFAFNALYMHGGCENNHNFWVLPVEKGTCKFNHIGAEM